MCNNRGSYIEKYLFNKTFMKMSRLYLIDFHIIVFAIYFYLKWMVWAASNIIIYCYSTTMKIHTVWRKTLFKCFNYCQKKKIFIKFKDEKTNVLTKLYLFSNENLLKTLCTGLYRFKLSIQIRCVCVCVCACKHTHTHACICLLYTSRCV